KIVSVKVTSLDQWLLRNHVSHVDFIKVDVEGAELDVLTGASRLLQNRPRPLIFAEVQDLRTAPWGYKAEEIVKFLNDADFTWFRLLTNGFVMRLDINQRSFDGNFLACPKESIHLLQEMVRQ